MERMKFREKAEKGKSRVSENGRKMAFFSVGKAKIHPHVRDIDLLLRTLDIE